ncbi:MAG: spore coat protein [Bacilli bacterium]
MQTQQQMTQLQEKDRMHQILIMLKHQAAEYTIAVTEANCAQVRQTMQRLLNETLAEQADCYQIMSRQGLYPPASAVGRQEVHKSIQTHRQDAQMTMHTMQAAGLHSAMQRAGGPDRQNGASQQWQRGAAGQQWQQPQQWQMTQNRPADQNPDAWRSPQAYQNPQAHLNATQGGFQGADQQYQRQPQQQAGHYQPWQADSRYQ